MIAITQIVDVGFVTIGDPVAAKCAIDLIARISSKKSPHTRSRVSKRIRKMLALYRRQDRVESRRLPRGILAQLKDGSLRRKLRSYVARQG